VASDGGRLRGPRLASLANRSTASRLADPITLRMACSGQRGPRLHGDRTERGDRPSHEGGTAATKTAPAAARRRGSSPGGDDRGTTFSVRFSGVPRDGEGVPEYYGDGCFSAPGRRRSRETERDDAQREREAAPLGAQPRSGILKRGGPHYGLRTGGVPRNQKRRGAHYELRTGGVPRNRKRRGAPLRASRWWGTPATENEGGATTTSFALVGYPRNGKRRGRPLRASRWWVPRTGNGGGAPLRASRWWSGTRTGKRRGQ